jgi:hypothetical protein
MLFKIQKSRKNLTRKVWTSFGRGRHCLGCKTGMVAKEKFPGDCEHGPRDFQLDIIHHGFETHNQASPAAGASKKTEIEVRY